MSDTTWVYVLWSDTDQLLYVGITNHLRRRLEEHQATKPWFWQVAHAQHFPFESRAEALLAEATLIRQYTPVYNIAHNDNERCHSRHAVPCWFCFDFGFRIWVDPWDDTRDDASWTWQSAHECRQCGSEFTVAWDYFTGDPVEFEEYLPVGWAA